MHTPAQRLRLLTLVCVDGAKYDRLQSQARLASLFASLAALSEHTLLSDGERDAATDACLRVAQTPDAHWRCCMFASCVLLRYALPTAASVDSERSARVVAHFADCAVGPLRQLHVIGRVATAWLLLHFKRHMSGDALLVRVRYNAPRFHGDQTRSWKNQVGPEPHPSESPAFFLKPGAEIIIHLCRRARTWSFFFARTAPGPTPMMFLGLGNHI